MSLPLWQRALVALPTLALASACSTDTITAPRSALPLGEANRAAATTLPSHLKPNSQRYANTGHKPSTGRSGSASIESRALLGKDGTLIIEATTGTLDASAAAPGQIVKVQLKNLTDSTTRNFNGLAAGGSWTHSMQQVSRGSMIQLQTSVRGIDRNRTDIVTVRDTVWRRPDLAVDNLQNPAQVVQNGIVAIAFQVREKNGDLGATANCVLKADGVEIGRANGIWTDKGDVVDCVFGQVTFATLGTKQLTASVESVVPADWDAANNVATGTIEVVSPERRLAGNQNFWARTYTYSWSSSSSYYGCGYYYYCGWENGERDERGWNAYGYESNGGSNGTPMGAVSFSVSRTTAGVTRTVAITAQPDYYYYYGYDCAYGYDQATNTEVQLCRYPWGQTNMHAWQHSGRVQYQGYRTDYYYYYNGYYYSQNFTYGEGPYAVGDDITLDVKATPTNGTPVRMGTTMALTSTSMDYDSNYCYYYSCWSETRRGTRKDGWASFQP